jgi:hypothetical protein
LKGNSSFFWLLEFDTLEFGSRLIVSTFRTACQSFNFCNRFNFEKVWFQFLVLWLRLWNFFVDCFLWYRQKPSHRHSEPGQRDPGRQRTSTNSPEEGSEESSGVYYDAKPTFWSTPHYISFLYLNEQTLKLIHL